MYSKVQNWSAIKELINTPNDYERRKSRVGEKHKLELYCLVFMSVVFLFVLHFACIVTFSPLISLLKPSESVERCITVSSVLLLAKVVVSPPCLKFGLCLTVGLVCARCPLSRYSVDFSHL